ncbi:hypothetical protein D8Y22_21745 [Salinadaptatus halalkaliphilus]|uniref:PGF-CTERM sorting domain-containing protein n=1 Tax=Salinadaptatus halalkaliphilus TaxID=2419781 RepID=A0A4S3TGR2_9EURY|nr:hypothetical protein [Salinadaptatus halalkaliphilus]THE63066.1 hypothetical protein D8Y22_21745 [Salinadaptatus halalkaliphilus]
MNVDASGSIGAIGFVMVVVLVIASCGTVVGSGSTGSETTSETVVTDEGAIESVESVVTVDDAGYDVLEMSAQQAGYDDVTDWYESLYADEPWIGTVSVSREDLEGGHQLTIVFEDLETDAVDRLDVYREGETVVYEELEVVAPAAGPQETTATHHVRMPGPVTDTNADEVSGNVATWTGEDLPNELSVESGIGDETAVGDGDSQHPHSDSELEGGEDGDSEHTDGVADGLSGFGGGVAVVALCVAIVALRRR